MIPIQPLTASQRPATQVITPLKQPALLNTFRGQSPRFSGFASIPTKDLQSFGWSLGFSALLTMIKPLVQNAAVKHEVFPTRDQQFLNKTEWIRQIVSTLLWSSFSFASLLLTRKYFPKLSAVETGMFSQALTSIPDTFLRPIITAKITKAILYRTPFKRHLEALTQTPSQIASDQQDFSIRPALVISAGYNPYYPSQEYGFRGLQPMPYQPRPV